MSDSAMVSSQCAVTSKATFTATLLTYSHVPKLSFHGEDMLGKKAWRPSFGKDHISQNSVIPWWIALGPVPMDLGYLPVKQDTGDLYGLIDGGSSCSHWISETPDESQHLNIHPVPYLKELMYIVLRTSSDSHQCLINLNYNYPYHDYSVTFAVPSPGQSLRVPDIV